MNSPPEGDAKAGHKDPGRRSCAFPSAYIVVRTSGPDNCVKKGAKVMEKTRIPPRQDAVRVALVVLAFIAAFIAVRYGAYLWLENRL